MKFAFRVENSLVSVMTTVKDPNERYTQFDANPIDYVDHMNGERSSQLTIKLGPKSNRHSRYSIKNVRKKHLFLTIFHSQSSTTPHHSIFAALKHIQIFTSFFLLNFCIAKSNRKDTKCWQQVSWWYFGIDLLLLLHHYYWCCWWLIAHASGENKNGSWFA